ncbi:MAG: hypothetical protein IMW89_08820 [Ktedonobacteraceae bacterium]|nr:hypothetical protein [Ktedonobacteraceae bacterium]
MKPETERLLHQCRAALLQYDNEQLNRLFLSWLERMIGEEDLAIDELLDDLCLLLGYKIRSSHSDLLYATYTAWWEVEGFADLDGEFVCTDVAALQQRLITLPIKQFDLITELAFQVCRRDAQDESQPGPPTGQQWFRTLTAWLNNGAREPLHKEIWEIWQREVQAASTIPQQQQLTRKQIKAQQRKLENALAEQAWQRGYLLLGSQVSNQVMILVQSRCKKNTRPFISVQETESQFASISIDLGTVRRAFEKQGKLFDGAPVPTFLPTGELQQRLIAFAEQYSANAKTTSRNAFTLSRREDVLELHQIPQEDVPRAVQDFMTLWPDILAEYEAQLAASRKAYEARQRELEEARKEAHKPAWLKTIERLGAPGQPISCPELAETVVLPESWPDLLTKEQLGAFLTFLKLPASSREIKTNLVQHLSAYMETDKTAKALLFEIFAFELGVPLYELETLLNCTTTERKRWTDEQKLPIVGYGNFRKAGSERAYPIYDRRAVLSLTPADIEGWRSEHQALVRERRRASAQAAAASRKAKRAAEQAARTAQAISTAHTPPENADSHPAADDTSSLPISTTLSGSGKSDC